MRATLPPLEAFARRLAQAERAVPVLVARLPELERVAWRRGLRAARALERRAADAFSRSAGAVLRGEDLLAHDAGSDVFVAALVASTRARGAAPVPVDARSALARIAAALESSTGVAVLTGWTTYEACADPPVIGEVLERALARGVQERERYAFFSALGHELRTPLSSIRGYLETLLDDAVDTATRRRFLRIAYDESLRMSRLVEGMFEISLLDLHPTLPIRSSGSLGEAVRAAHDACAANATKRRVAIAMDHVPPTSVGLDVDRLTLILVNVIDNAVKHGRPGGGVFVGVDDAHGRFVRVTVDDDGHGIAAGDRERIFALGERASTNAEGTGIGLALVRLMLERAGGRADLEESPLGGARFVLTLPRV